MEVVGGDLEAAGGVGVAGDEPADAQLGEAEALAGRAEGDRVVGDETCGAAGRGGVEVEGVLEQGLANFSAALDDLQGGPRLEAPPPPRAA